MANSTKLRLGTLTALAATALALTACGSSASSTSAQSSGAPSAPSSTSTAASTGVAIKTAKGPGGVRYLVGPTGRALYLWVADGAGKSSCSGSCAQAWPPLTTTSTPVALGGAMSADLGMITRSDGTKQVTYKGHPLYYYAGDSGAGSVNGQGSDGFGAKWWLVSPSGTAITSQSSPSSGSSGGGWA